MSHSSPVLADVKSNNGGRGQTIDYWTNQKLESPELSIGITVLKSGSVCKGSAKASKAHLKQDWAGYGCSFNPSISVALPWGIGVSGWPNCASRIQAGYRSDPSGSYSTYHQYNSGSPASYGDFELPFTITSQPCYGVYPTITVYFGNSSDSYGAGDTQAKEVCLPWHGSRT